MAKVRLNEDKEVVKMIKDGLKARGGYCPCRREKTEDNKCIHMNTGSILIEP